MKRLLLLLGLLLPMFAAAQSPFDGTWKVDLAKSQPPKKPDTWDLQNGMFSCKSCVPPYDVKADGQFQSVSGHRNYDKISVKIVDDQHIEFASQKGGKDTFQSHDVLSNNNDTLTMTWTDSSGTAPVNGTTVFKRVGKAPAGAHAYSGSWRVEKLEGMSNSGLEVTYKGAGDILSMSTPTGQSYEAKLDGSDAPYKGDPNVTSVSLKQVGNDSIEETDKRDGKVVSVTKMTVSKDGKTLTFDVNDKLHGTTSRWVAEKQ